MIIPFKNEVTIDLECKNESIERLYNMPHFRQAQEHARSQLLHYLNTGDLPSTTLNRVIGQENAGLHNALYLANQYKKTHYDNSLHLIESALVQTHFSNVENDNGNQIHFYSSRQQNKERIQLRFPHLSSTLRNDSTESGFHIAMLFQNSVCLQPDWTEKQCRDAIIEILEKSIFRKIDTPYFRNDHLEDRCIELDVFSIGNPNLSVILNLTENLPNYLVVKDIQCHYHYNEWVQPNIRYTIQHLNKSAELYISIYPVPMNRVEQILTNECNQLLDSITLLPESNSSLPQTEFNTLVDGVEAVLHNLTHNIRSLSAVSNTLWAYNKQRDFLRAFSNHRSYYFHRHDVYIKLLVQMYGIIRAYNVYRTAMLKKPTSNHFLQPSTSTTPDLSHGLPLLRNSVTTIEDLLLEGITSFKSHKDNWLEKSTDNKLIFRKETELTKKLRSYLHRNNVVMSLENDRNAGRSDLEVTFLNSQAIQRAIIENKRITTDDTHYKIIDKYCNALHQIKHYLEGYDAEGYILFFVFQRDVAEIEKLLLGCDKKLKKIDSSLFCNGFHLIHDNKYKIKLISLPIEPPTITYKESKITKAIKECFKSSKYLSSVG
ncbi:MAG: hypothetical protein KJ856_10135 [Gammaproteobacteria bacterium]|nr:hypothetical protein [Gammaproteobacteria bacterium]MBU1479405.1 hypothetical protein [Gammaproteobacteria bacterium]MBU2002113.1 hypothetical protein [Gammaproteobacteria bacterium]MBU2187360.1 hypothetical protein [Gammaproteobacteria bacterium]MBU2297474.1 hypothetical protein [Gammaproteobacteria bacterium]